MEDSWENCFSHLDMNGDYSFNQCQMNSFDNIEELHRNILQQPALSSKTDSLYPSSGLQSNSAAAVVSSLSLDEIGFNGQCSYSSNAVPAGGIWEPSSKQDYSCLKPNCEQLDRSLPHLSSKRTLGNLNFEPRVSQGTKRARSSSEAQDHIMSERKRRQEMAERFIALSAIIPGLKKMDKASVLREAINYVKQLQERIAVLAKKSKKKSTKSMIFIKKSHLCSASCETNSKEHCGFNEVLPEVEVIGLEKEVLIRVHCEKRKGITLKLLALLQNNHLSVASSSILPFGNSILNITIIAQMGEEYNMTVNELVKNLRQDLLQLYDMKE